MENIICFAIGLFFGILLVALMEHARANTEPGHIECDKAIVYGDDEEDDEDDEDYEDGE